MPVLPAKRCSSFLPLTFHWFVAASSSLKSSSLPLLCPLPPVGGSSGGMGWRTQKQLEHDGRQVSVFFGETCASSLLLRKISTSMTRLRVACECVCVWLRSSAVSLWLIYHCLSNYHTGPYVFLSSAADTLTHSGSFLLPMQIKAPVNICA